jgi:hypothetical protein
VSTKCVLVCNLYPSWIFVLGELRLEPLWILVTDTRLSPDDGALEAEEWDAALEDAACQKREQKATKADDAPIPEYLWEEHLLSDGPTPWVVTDFVKLRKAMDLLRARML